MKKVIKGAKKIAELAVEHKKKLSIVTILVVLLLVWFFWADITYIITITIPNFFVELYNGITKNWLKIGLTLFLYKFTILVVSNLSKRAFINRSVERFKKSLIYSELDELIHIFFRIKSEDFYLKLKKWEEIPYIGFIISIFVKFISWILFVIMFFIALFKFGLGKLLLTKVLSAQFWTNILMFVMNIPGFFVITGLIIWLWLEAHLPWIPRFYYWVSMKLRIFLDPIWDSFVVPLAEKVSIVLISFENKVIEPIGKWFDNLELKAIYRLKEYIYYRKGEEKYNKYMKLVRIHNTSQLREKEKKLKELRVKQFSVMRRRVETLRKLKQKKKKKEKK